MTLCKTDDCKGKQKRAYYNYTGLKPKFCSNCKKPDMIDVLHPKCITCKDKIPIYNLATESKGLYCSNCKKPDMIDVLHPKCITCKDKQPVFNIPTESKGLYCYNC